MKLIKTQKSRISIATITLSLVLFVYFHQIHMQKNTTPSLSKTVLLVSSILLLLFCNLLAVLLLLYIEKTKQYKLTLLYDKETGCYTNDTFQALCYEHIILGQTYELVLLNLSFFETETDQKNNKNQILSEITKIIKNTIPKEDLYGKVAFNQFAFMISTESNVTKLIRTISNSIENLSYQNFSYEFSACNIDSIQPNITKSIQNALLALQYKQGATYANCTFYSQSILDQWYEKQQLRQQLVSALEKKEFHLYLQPKFNLETNLCIGAEALVRWHHPQKGILFPNDFLSLLEEADLIYQLDCYLWEETCKTLLNWEQLHYVPIPISINITGSEMKKKPLNVLNNLLFKYHISINQLQLELTEDMFFSPELVAAQIKEIKKYGYTLCMDDFGSGYSSLRQLKDWNIDIIKIDKSFLDGIDDENAIASITLEHIISLIQDLGLKMVVEGIETEKQKNFLLSHGCKVGQGYYFSKPIPVEQFVTLLQLKH